MRTYLGLGCAALLAVAGPAAASGTEDVGVNASVTASCTLTTLLDSIEVISAPFPGEHDLGTLGYTCNFGHDLQFPSLKIKANGGTILVNTTDGDAVQYAVKWTVPLAGPSMGFQTAASTATFGPFAGEQGPLANVEQTGSVIVNLLGDLTHAGTYTDTLIFSVSP